MHRSRERRKHKSGDKLPPPPVMQGVSLGHGLSQGLSQAPLQHSVLVSNISEAQTNKIVNNQDNQLQEFYPIFVGPRSRSRTLEGGEEALSREQFSYKISDSIMAILNHNSNLFLADKYRSLPRDKDLYQHQFRSSPRVKKRHMSSLHNLCDYNHQVQGPSLGQGLGGLVQQNHLSLGY